jgi:gamma-glutamyltranspeptidase/glutathione hydrolase
MGTRSPVGITLGTCVLAATACVSACGTRHEPAPREGHPHIRASEVAAQEGSAGSNAVAAAAGSAASPVGVRDVTAGSGGVPVYRTSVSGWHVDPALVADGTSFMVASEDATASDVGRDILANGGDAVDAAVATAFALAVTHPSAGNLTGGGFAVVRIDAKTEVALDFRETAPAAATSDMFLDKAGKPTADSLVGDRASGVPGSVAGLFALHQRYGKLPWSQLIAPSIARAQHGYVVDHWLHDGLTKVAAKLAMNPAAAALYLVNGRAPAIGATIKNPDLAVVLQRIAAHGPDGFYKGDTAAAIVAEMKSGGGLITAADLSGYRPVWREPLRFNYRGYFLASMPPPSSGGIVLAMTAAMLHATDLGKLGWHSASHVHWLVEVWRRAYAARNELLGDPAFVKDMPLAKLTSESYADQLVASIAPARATPSKATPSIIDGTHTTNLSVVDGHGMAVALTTTLNTAFGNLVVVPGTGMLLNNEMDDFAVKPGSPNVFGLVQGTANRIEPGKRMLSSMSPTIVEDAKHQVVLVVGAQGGPRIITDVFQTISNVVDFGMSVEAAVAAPRVHHQHLPDKVFVQDDAIDQPAADALARMGYTLDWVADPHQFGGVTAIARTPTGWRGTADPHTGGGAAGH